MDMTFFGAQRFNQNLAAWNVTGLTGNLNFFATNSGMTPVNMDRTLTG
jgi:hypothetical protein